MRAKTKVKPNYYIDGKAVPSVTEVIGNNLGWNKNVLIGWARKQAKLGIDPHAIRDQAADIGTITHALIESFITGEEFDRDQYAPMDVEVAERAFGGFMEWFEEQDIKIRDSEIMLTHKEYFYGGTIDLLCDLNGRFALVDFKSSTGVYLEHRIQLAAYKHLVAQGPAEGGVPECHLLHLDKRTGSYHLHTYPNLDREWQVFLHLRRLHDLRKDLENGE